MHTHTDRELSIYTLPSFHAEKMLSYMEKCSNMTKNLEVNSSSIRPAKYKEKDISRKRLNFLGNGFGGW